MPASEIPPELRFENAPFRGQPTTFQHSLVYVLGDCLQATKTQRDYHQPKTAHHNAQIILLACAFFESALSRGLVNAAQHRLRCLGTNSNAAAIRADLEAEIDALFDGETYGDPLAKKIGSYANAAKIILKIDFEKAVSPEIRAAVRALFQLRNIVIHGQTVAADGVFPSDFSKPVENYHLRTTKRTAELKAHLRSKNLISPATLEAGIGFPFLTSDTVDHFLRALVEFFRAVQPAIADATLRHEFGSGIPQNIFPILAGEAQLF